MNAEAVVGRPHQLFSGGCGGDKQKWVACLWSYLLLKLIILPAFISRFSSIQRVLPSFLRQPKFDSLLSVMHRPGRFITSKTVQYCKSTVTDKMDALQLKLIQKLWLHQLLNRFIQNLKDGFWNRYGLLIQIFQSFLFDFQY